MLRRGLTLHVKMTEPGHDVLTLATASSNLARNVTIARKTVTFSKAGTKKVTLKLNRTARRARAKLLRLPKLRLVLRSTAKDRAGNTRVTTKRLTLRR